MSSEHLHHPASSSHAGKPARALGVAAVMVAAIAAFFLLREHWGHVTGYWPYLLLLACPLMHLFHGHGGHGHGAHRGGSRLPTRDE